MYLGGDMTDCLVFHNYLWYIENLHEKWGSTRMHSIANVTGDYFILLETFKYISQTPCHCLVGWGSRIHRLLLSRGVRPSSMNVLDMTLNNLMVRFHECWNFVGSGVSLYCHCSQLHSGLEVEPDKGPIYRLNRTKPKLLEFTVFFLHLNGVFMLNWIV